MAKQIEAADLVELLAHPLQQGGFRLAAMVFLQHLPGVGLGLLHPGDQIGRVESKLAAVGRGAALFVEPAVAAKVLADLLLKSNFVVEAHRLSSWAMATIQRGSLGRQGIANPGVMQNPHQLAPWDRRFTG
jgi:hypothetical protein